MTNFTPLTATAPRPIEPAQPDRQLRQVAQDLEASFLAEMLKSAGLGKPREAFGGGAGEEHFASFMVEAQAKAIVADGGIGLAEHIYQSIKGDSE